jgi:membrane associated rhomboid family serine protease
MFLHFEIWHLFANMISLYFVGNFVEKLIGKKRFILVYLFSGIFAGLFWVITSNFLSLNIILTRIFGDPLIYGIGASGAVFGLVGILAVLTPNARISFIAGPLVAFILLGILSNATVIPSQILNVLDIIFFVYIFVTFFAMLSFNPNLIRLALPVDTTMAGLAFLAIIPLIILSIFVDLPIGNMAHLGGLIFGLMYASYLRKKFPRRSKIIAQMFR